MYTAFGGQRRARPTRVRSKIQICKLSGSRYPYWGSFVFLKATTVDQDISIPREASLFYWGKAKERVSDVSVFVFFSRAVHQGKEKTERDRD